LFFFFFSSRRRHTRSDRDWSSDVCSSDLGACLAWAVDNNLTRKVSQADPVQIALLKGCVAGAVNVGIALWLGSAVPPPGALGAAVVVGFSGYGVSLVLFVIALRHIGTART